MGVGILFGPSLLVFSFFLLSVTAIMLLMTLVRRVPLNRMMLRLHSSRDIVGVMMMMMSRSAQDGVSAVVDDADGDGLLFQISPVLTMKAKSCV